MALFDGNIPLPGAIQSPSVDFHKPIESSSLKGMTILITGGASGLGSAMFQSFASYLATVIIGDINTSLGESLVATTRQTSSNQNLHFLHLDVTSWSSQLAFFKQATQLSPHGGIDAVITCAGIADPDEAMGFETPPDYHSLTTPPSPPTFKTITVNLTGTLYTTHLATSYLNHNPGSHPCSLTSTPATSPARDRHLLLVSSIAGLQPLPTQSLYTVSKHGVVGLFRSLRTHFPTTHGIRVNMLCPYYVDTPILGPLGQISLAGAAPARIEDVVDAAVRLVADTTIIGRGLAIGNRASVDQIKAVGLEEVAGKEERAIWDVYADDFEQSDVVTRRVVALTNLAARAKGWMAFWGEIGWAVTAPARRLLGYV